MNRAKSVVATAVIAACAAWPLVTVAQAGGGASGGGGSSAGSGGGSPSGSTDNGPHPMMGSGASGTSGGATGASGTTGMGGASGMSGMGGRPAASGTYGSGSAPLPGTTGSQPTDSARATTGNQGSATAPGGNVSSADRDFVSNAASGGLLEVEASRLALERSQSAEVRSFAQRMIDDHTVANRDLMAAAASAGVTDVPTTLASKHQAIYNRLRTANGAEFDRLYAETVGLTAHQETVALFQREASEGSHPALKAFATKTLPELRGHLQQSQTVASATGVPLDRMQAYSPTLDQTSGSAGALASGGAASGASGTSGTTTDSSSGRSSYGSTGSGMQSAGTSSRYSNSRDTTTGQQMGPGWGNAGLVGPYVGGSVGMSNYGSDPCVGQCDKTDWGGKIFGGYMFTPWIGAEIDYGWFGKTKINTTSFIGTTPVNSSAEIKTDGFSGFLVGQYPVDNFRPFAKIGFARLNTSVNGAINGVQLVDNNDPSFEFAWGVGVGYMFDRNLGVRAEYEARQYKWEGDKNTLGFWSVGLQYHF